MSSSCVAECLTNVRSQIQSICASCGRTNSIPRLVAVSKTKPVEMLMEAYQVGQRHFGENYVQELVEKAPQMPNDVKWHFIGHLQSNKAKLIAGIPNLYMVESIDSVKLANLLDKCVAGVEGREEKLKVMVQVNTSGEESKSGVEPNGCVGLASHIVENCSNLEFVGLMTIGRLGDISPECFQLLTRCGEEVKEKFEINELEYSMGMSADYAIAIEHGSTNIRVGSTIFGARQYNK